MKINYIILIYMSVLQNGSVGTGSQVYSNPNTSYFAYANSNGNGNGNSTGNFNSINVAQNANINTLNVSGVSTLPNILTTNVHITPANGAIPFSYSLVVASNDQLQLQNALNTVAIGVDQSTGNVTVGNLNVTGVLSANINVGTNFSSINVTGNSNFANLNVSGTITGNFNVNQTSNFATINIAGNGGNTIEILGANATSKSLIVSNGSAVGVLYDSVINPPPTANGTGLTTTLFINSALSPTLAQFNFSGPYTGNCLLSMPAQVNGVAVVNNASSDTYTMYAVNYNSGSPVVIGGTTLGQTLSVPLSNFRLFNPSIFIPNMVSGYSYQLAYGVVGNYTFNASSQFSAFVTKLS